MEIRDLIQKFDAHHAAVEKLAADSGAELKTIDARLGEIEQRIVRRGGGFAGPDLPKSWGQSILESPQFEAFKNAGARGMARIECKTVQTIGSGSTAAGPTIAPDVLVNANVFPRLRFTIRQLLGKGTTNSNSVWYPRMTARQNNAATVAEGTLKPQSDFSIQQIQTPVSTLAHWILLARQALDDSASLMSLVDGELKYGLSYTEEQQLLFGDGTGVNLFGIMPQATAYSGAFSVTGETAIDRIQLAINQAELALLPASGIVLNTSDWARIRLTKNGMGNYIMGDPASNAAPYMWGLPVVVTPAMTVNNFLVGAFDSAAMIFDRLTLEILLSTEDSDNFRRNLITARAESRLALCIFRPAAFITGTLP